MADTLERTVSLDRDLVRRADRKLRYYGRSFDDAIAYVLNIVVSKSGNPFLNDGQSARRKAFVRSCKKSRAEIDAGLATPATVDELMSAFDD